MRKIFPAKAPFAVILAVLATPVAQAQYTPYWYDGFNTSASSQDINFQIGSPRQGGTGIPTTWLSNGGPGDYHDQIAGGTVLLLAGDAANTMPLASPNLNFSGLTGGGDVIGTRITLSIQPGTINAGGRYTQTGITLGSSSTLVPGGTAGSSFSVRFVEDLFGGNGAFLQLFDGNTLVGNLLPNPAGFGNINLQLDISDTDGNPWNGVGGTTIDIFVNSTLAGSYTRGGGGYTDNFLTLEASPNFVGLGLEVSYFDDLTVYISPVPEPSTFALTGLGLAALVIFRRRKS
jgi:hypothetical protein